MDVTCRQTNWHNLTAWTLENEAMRTVVVPELGGKLVSLFHKPTQSEWLAGPGSRPVQRVPYGALFQEQDMSGWDEMFPTIVACHYPGPGSNTGVPLPDHGEVWTLPWQVDQSSNNKLVLRVEGRALPYRLTRTMEYSASTVLQLHYQLVNLGQDVMPYIWAAHPQFMCGQQAEVILPAHVTTVCNTIPESWGWGAPETRFDWPVARSVDGRRVRLDQIGPPALKQARKFFVLPQVKTGWVGLIRYPAKEWLRLDWDPDQIHYLGLWIDEGALNHQSVATPEPTTGFYDSLTVAWDKKRVTVIEPGAVQSWTLTVRIGTGEYPFPQKMTRRNRNE